MAKSHHTPVDMRAAQSVVVGEAFGGKGKDEQEEFQKIVRAMHEVLGLGEKPVETSKGKQVWLSFGFSDGGQELARHIVVYESHKVYKKRIVRRLGPATRFVVVVAPGNAFTTQKTGVKPSHPGFVPGRREKNEEALLRLPALRHTGGGGLMPPMTAAAGNASNGAVDEYMRAHPDEFPGVVPNPDLFARVDRTPPPRPEAPADHNPVGEAARQLMVLYRQAAAMEGYGLKSLPYAVTDRVRRGQALRDVADLAVQQGVLRRTVAGRLVAVSQPGRGVPDPDAVVLARALNGS
jgi:hypothetical protein